MPEESKDEMTPAQRAAISKAWDLLGEHFDRVLLVVDWETNDGCDAHEGYWHGGSLPAVGLAEFAKDRILRSRLKTNEPNE